MEVAEKNHKGTDDPRLISAGWSNWLPAIIEVNRWDGSDFIFGSLDKGLRNHVVTRRVIDCFFTIDAKPFYARPVLANVENALPEKLQMLQRVVGSNSYS
jgi:hypothetical protein